MAPNAKDRMLLDKAKAPNFKEVSPVIRAALALSALIHMLRPELRFSPEMLCIALFGAVRC